MKEIFDGLLNNMAQANLTQEELLPYGLLGLYCRISGYNDPYGHSRYCYTGKIIGKEENSYLVQRLDDAGEEIDIVCCPFDSLQNPDTVIFYRTFEKAKGA